MAIHRRVFERLGPRPFKEPTGPDGKRAMGEDMAFCREAGSAGFKVTIVPSVVYNHVKPVGLRELYESLLAYAAAGKKAGYAAGYQEGLKASAEMPSFARAGPTSSNCTAVPSRDSSKKSKRCRYRRTFGSGSESVVR